MPKFQLGQKVKVIETGVIFEVFAIEKIGSYYFYLIPGRKLVPEDQLETIPSLTGCSTKISVSQEALSSWVRDQDNVFDNRRYAYRSIRDGEIRYYNWPWTGNQNFRRAPQFDKKVCCEKK